MGTSDKNAAKKAAAEAALAYVPNSGIVGLGTGSTARYFIDGVARLIKEGRKLTCVPTSEQSRFQAEQLGIPLAPADGPWDIALTVDGADEVSAALNLIKGGGAAHTHEKIVNNASRMNIIVIDESKLSQKLGEKWQIPIEVLAFAHLTTLKALEVFGPATIRRIEGAPIRTDSGGYIIDLAYGVIDQPEELESQLRALPGVVETGLFCKRTDLVIVAGASGIRELR